MDRRRTIRPLTVDERIRFWDKVQLGRDDECWPYVGGALYRATGYGAFAVDGENHTAHNVAYSLTHGFIPPGDWQVDHTCHDPETCRDSPCAHRACCNPAHLELVTQRENIGRGGSPAAVNARKTHCPQGHPLSGDNLRYESGRRVCRTCRRATLRRWRERQVAK